jgi:hypothetical protein
MNVEDSGLRAAPPRAVSDHPVFMGPGLSLRENRDDTE